MNLHLNILDDKRREILPLFKNFSNDGFYLAGGTGLALQISHRDSVDFDDIIEEPILFKENHNVSLETIKVFLQKTIKEYLLL